MNIELIGFTLATVGHVLIAYTVIMVHKRVKEEHRIDDEVLRTMTKEQTYAVIGMLCIIAGYVLELPARFF